MPMTVGERLPEVDVQWMTADGVQKASITSLCAGRKVALFSVPGAFTPSCQDEHLPGFVVRAPEILAAGIDQIYCVAVNDAFVLSAWAEARQVGEQLQMLADGNAELARAMDLELDLGRFGMGLRARRYAAIVDDNVLTWLGIEPAGGVTVSSAAALLSELSDP